MSTLAICFQMAMQIWIQFPDCLSLLHVGWILRAVWCPWTTFLRRRVKQLFLKNTLNAICYLTGAFVSDLFCGLHKIIQCAPNTFSLLGSSKSHFRCRCSAQANKLNLIEGNAHNRRQWRREEPHHQRLEPTDPILMCQITWLKSEEFGEVKSLFVVLI